MVNNLYKQSACMLIRLARHLIQSISPPFFLWGIAETFCLLLQFTKLPFQFVYFLPISTPGLVAHPWVSSSYSVLQLEDFRQVS